MTPCIEIGLDILFEDGICGEVIGGDDGIAGELV